MPDSNPTVSQIRVRIQNRELTDAQYDELLEMVVDQSTSLPDMFTLTFRDDDKEWVDSNLLKPGNAVKIEATDDTGRNWVSLIEGEITALEPRFREGMLIDMVARGYDKTHRMFREVKSRTFENAKDSDIANTIAGEYSLAAQVKATTELYPHIYQHNQTDMAFLVERAWRIGYECFASEGKLYFRTPPTGERAVVSLEFGTALQSFDPVMSTAEQVDEVAVYGWDPKNKKEIVGRATAGELYAKVSDDGKTLAKGFGKGKKVVVNQPVISQGEANALAQARLNEISGAFVQASGMAYRTPQIRAGKVIELKNLGTRFGGKYFVTGARHVFDSNGLRTDFEVRGLRSGLLGEELVHREPTERWPGAVVGIVTDNNDPDKMCRVKVKYPWLNDNANSCWARVISPGAGKDAGLFILPEINDEVMVIFEHGDFDYPYVLGGVYNGKSPIPGPGQSSASSEKAKVRTWYSPKGHKITVHDDTQSDNKIEITTGAGHTIVLDDKNEKIEVKSKGGHKLVIDDKGKKVTVESLEELEIKSLKDMKITSTTNMTIKAIKSMKIEGATVDVNAQSMLTLKGSMTKIN